MKIALFVALLSFAQTAAFAVDTAYTALRVMAKDRGESSLNRVVELRGRNGRPHPDVWRITLDEPSARGGLREVEVQRGRVISQRTPVSRPLGKPINLNQLNLDSEGVFTLVNQETQKAGVIFDRVDYTLRSAARGGAPVWTTDIFNREQGRVGVLEISAESGEILRRELGRGYDREYTRSDEDFLRRDADPNLQREERQEVYVERDEEGVSSFFDRLERRFKRRGRQFENFFTGRGFTDDQEPRER